MRVYYAHTVSEWSRMPDMPSQHLGCPLHSRVVILLPLGRFGFKQMLQCI